MMYTGLPAIDYLLAVLQDRRIRARGHDDRGASIVEWVLISGILVVLAGVVFTVLRGKITDAVNNINLRP